MKTRWVLVVGGLLLATTADAGPTDVADAAKRGDRTAVRTALARKADVNAAQVDGSTALHWAVERDDAEMADVLIRAGARITARTREGVTPLQLAATNGSASMIDRLLKAGAKPNEPLTQARDTALMMAARTGGTGAIRLLVEAGADVNVKETWGGTTALMWAVSEGHLEAARLLIAAGADVKARSNFVAAANGRGFEGRTPLTNATDAKPAEFASGWLTPLMLAAREGHVELSRLLVSAGADVNAAAGDGKTALALAIFNGNYEVASFLVDNKADVNVADAQLFTPLFYAVDGDARPAAGHPQDARCRHHPERIGQQHAARAHARRLPAHRLCHGADARRLCRGSRAGEAAPRPRRRPEDHLQGQREHAVGGGRSRLHPWVSPWQVAGRAAAGGEAVRGTG